MKLSSCCFYVVFLFFFFSLSRLLLFVLLFAPTKDLDKIMDPNWRQCLVPAWGPLSRFWALLCKHNGNQPRQRHQQMLQFVLSIFFWPRGEDNKHANLIRMWGPLSDPHGQLRGWTLTPLMRGVWTVRVLQWMLVVSPHGNGVLLSACALAILTLDPQPSSIFLQFPVTSPQQPLVSAGDATSLHGSLCVLAGDFCM